VGAQFYCDADTIANHRQAGRPTADLVKYYVKGGGDVPGWIPVLPENPYAAEAAKDLAW
jgi:hypothetical protein